MSDNTLLSLQQAAAAVLDPLLEQPPTGPLPPDGVLAPGVWIHADPEGQQQVESLQLPGGGLTLRTTVQHPGGWLALHIALGEVDLSDHVLIGFYARIQAPRACTWRACLRSGTEVGFVDHFFDRDVVSYGAASSHMDMMELAPQRRLPRRADWREFILFFHVESFETTLLDLRLFAA
ncbi:MAG: hypothetical protein COB16_11635 [Rhodobacteraceae bacterium]|nr:MAG: hypothetical protein COB16_11635 [Paracoccaceae bacterium]